MSCFLGISTYYHDSAAAIVVDGEIVAAAQEERFSRLKHDSRFPVGAVAYCLGEAFIEPSQIDAIVFHDDPLLHLDRFFTNAVAVAPRGRDTFIAGCQAQLGEKVRLAEDVEACLGEVPMLLSAGHHMAHAASAFYPSPFADAAILTLDGVGEWATCTIGRGNDQSIEVLREINYPHSIGLLYSAFTQFCGFKVNSGEYKLMGLAPYGTPRYADVIRRELVDIRPDGSFRLNAQAFGFLDTRSMMGPVFETLFDGPARAPAARFTRREMDLAASVQLVTEEIMLALAREAIKQAGSNNLVLAGGVALNCVANGRIQRELALEGLFIQPAADDSGGALGAALIGAHALAGEPRRTVGKNQSAGAEPARIDAMKGARLGPEFSPHEVDAVLARFSAPGDRVRDAGARADRIAAALAEGLVVGHFAGRMEFGPRALGGRSILADPRRPEMQRRLNVKIKNRESFRPFAPMVLAEQAADYFELEGESPYMLLVAPVRSERRIEMPLGLDATDDALILVDQIRSDIPAVTHVDYSARVQTVDADRAPDLHELLEAFHARTGCAVLVNTSFNVRGEPIVCSPHDAYRCFMLTDMDMLVLGERILLKAEQPPFTGDRPDMDDPEPIDDLTVPTGGAEAGDRQAADLASSLFDAVIVPLAAARRAAGHPSFPMGPDATRDSYFELPRIHATGLDMRYPGTGTIDGFIAALIEFWRRSGEPEFAALAPRLKQIADAMKKTAQRSDGEVDIFVYTMF